VTALLCAAGVYLGAVAGTRFGRHAEALGGVLLVALGIKILVEHQFMGG
jgi:putative Mn2+ efflux pump MntP